MENQLNILKTKIQSLRFLALAGGWGEQFENNCIDVDSNGQNILLHEINLFKLNESFISRQKKYTISISVIKDVLKLLRMIESIHNYLESRLDTSEWIDLKLSRKFINDVSDLML